MLESVYLTSAEKKEFLHEFVQGMVDVIKKEQEKAGAEIKMGEVAREEGVEKEREREKALEKVKLIMRQFPRGGMPAAIEQQMPKIEMPEKPETAVLLQKGQVQFLTSNEKVDSLLNDDAIRIIECSDGILRVNTGSGKGNEETGFRLDEQEIKEIIKKFSEKARIPLAGGIFKASIGNLMINAIISDAIGSRFLIIKS